MQVWFWAFTLLTSLEASPVRTAQFAVDDLTRVTPSVLATVERREDAPHAAWIRMYFYSFDLTPAQRAMAVTGGDSALLRSWDAILQLTVDDGGAVSAMDMALPGRICAVAESPQDAARAVQHFEFDGARLRLKSTAFSICDLKVEDVPSQRFEWDVDIDTLVVAKAPTLK